MVMINVINAINTTNTTNGHGKKYHTINIHKDLRSI